MDPEYTYVKGQGWVIRTNPVFKLIDGQTVELIIRSPVEGDRYWGFHKVYDKSWFINGEVDLEHVQTEAMHYKLKDLSVWYDEFKPKPNYVYVVVSPV